jgi:hypothetical protein
MPERTAIINIVGLTPRILNGADTPKLSALARTGGLLKVKPVLPAVTCTAQSTYLTGLPPSGHGCVANGWYDRTLAEHQFWKQSNHVVQGPKLWESAARAASRLHLRETVLVVQYVLDRRLVDHAAADVPGRWAQGIRRLHASDGNARRDQKGSRPLSLFPRFGARWRA